MAQNLRAKGKADKKARDIKVAKTPKRKKRKR